MTNGQAEAFPKSSGRPQLELSRTERWNIPELIGALLGKSEPTKPRQVENGYNGGKSKGRGKSKASLG